jgi:heme-degrading monooxygenase HmoA
MIAESQFAYVWAFRVGDGNESRFEQLYGPDGAWVQLFSMGTGYLGTELLRDVAQPGRYVTIDRWTSEDAYHAFRRAWDKEYLALDEAWESLTLEEQSLGSFVPCS